MSDLSDDSELMPCSDAQPAGYKHAAASKKKQLPQQEKQAKAPQQVAQNYDGQQLKQMYEKVRSLEEENQQLTQQIYQQNNSIEPSPLTLYLSSEASKKFAEMAAKNRQLQAALEVQKNKVQQQNQLIYQLKQENYQLFSTIERINGTANTVPDDSEVVLGLKKQIQQAQREQNKLLEQVGSLKVSTSSLNLENSKLKLLLYKETGQEFYSLEVNQFQGRAEKIIELYNKLRYAHKTIKDLQSGAAPAVPTDKEMEERIKNDFREQLEDYEVVIQEKSQQLASVIYQHNQLYEKYRKQQARVASLENDNAVIRGHVKTFVKKSEVDNILVERFRKFLDKPENLEILKQRYAANEARAVAAEQKLSGLMQTMAGSDSQLQIIAAGAYLEAYQYKEMISHLREDNKILKGLLEQLIGEVLGKIGGDETITNLFRQMQNAYKAQEAAQDTAIQSYYQIIYQFNSHLQLDEEFKEIGNQFYAQFAGTQNILQATRDQRTRDALYDRLAEYALANKPQKRVKKVVSEQTLEQKYQGYSGQRVGSVEKYREDAARKTPKPLSYDRKQSTERDGAVLHRDGEGAQPQEYYAPEEDEYWSPEGDPHAVEEPKAASEQSED